MPPAERLRAQTAIPVVAAPMFLVSGVELVAACCENGVIGSFPSLNGRTAEDFEAMLTALDERLESYRSEHPDAVVAPYAVNLIVHASNTRIEEDLALCEKHRVPLIITSLGKPTAVAEAVHGYGGLVVSDVASVQHARKALECDVDGLIAVCSGAGGHAGRLNPFAFVAAVRQFHDGLLLLAGCLSDGRAVRACEALGADFAYMGTRFVATQESLAPDEYKAMICRASATDIVYTPAVSGVHANFLRESLERAGISLDSATQPTPGFGGASSEDEMKAWRDIWSAGQGVEAIGDVPTVRELVASLRKGYAAS